MSGNSIDFHLVLETLTAITTAFLAYFTWRLARATVNLVSDSHASAENQLKLVAKQMQIEILMKNEEMFSSERLIKIRRLSAADARHSILEDKPLVWPQPMIDGLLGYFDSLGMLVKSIGIPMEMVWSVFGYYILGWHYAADPYIEYCQSYDPTYYQNFVWLAEEIRKIEINIRKRSIEDIAYDNSSIIGFLDEERVVA